MFKGGVESGYSKDKDPYLSEPFYEGGVGQGYDKMIKYADFIWTGLIGTGWRVAVNWNFTSYQISTDR